MPESAELRPFSRSLPMALLRAREASMKMFRQSLTAHGVTEQQWRTLRALSAAPEAIDISALSDATFLLGPSLTRILAKLDERGYITRQTDDADHRRRLITISDEGRDLIAALAPHSERIYAQIEAAFGAQRLQRLYKMLDELASISTTLESEEAGDDDR